MSNKVYDKARKKLKKRANLKLAINSKEYQKIKFKPSFACKTYLMPKMWL